VDSSGAYGSHLDPNDYPDNLIQVYNQYGIRISKIIGCN
jgi:hypothetical protein